MLLLYHLFDSLLLICRLALRPFAGYHCQWSLAGMHCPFLYLCVCFLNDYPSSLVMTFHIKQIGVLWWLMSQCMNKFLYFLKLFSIMYPCRNRQHVLITDIDPFCYVAPSPNGWSLIWTCPNKMVEQKTYGAQGHTHTFCTSGWLTCSPKNCWFNHLYLQLHGH